MFSDIVKIINKILFKEVKAETPWNKEVNLIELWKMLLWFVPILLVIWASYQFSILLSINALRYFSWQQVFSDSSIIAIMLSAIVFWIYVAYWIFELNTENSDWKKIISTLFFLIIIIIPLIFLKGNQYYAALFFYNIYFLFGQWHCVFLCGKIIKC